MALPFRIRATLRRNRFYRCVRASPWRVRPRVHVPRFLSSSYLLLKHRVLSSRAHIFVRSETFSSSDHSFVYSMLVAHGGRWSPKAFQRVFGVVEDRSPIGRDVLRNVVKLSVVQSRTPYAATPRCRRRSRAAVGLHQPDAVPWKGF